MRTEPPMTPRATVGVAACGAYDADRVRSAVSTCLAPFGGMAAFVRSGERIALKPNLLLGATPDSAVTTHPAVVEAVATAVSECGAYPVLVESPGSGIPYSRSSLRRVYRRTGMLEVAERTGLELNYDTSAQAVHLPDGVATHRIDVLTPILEVDGVISLPKLKTHYFMTYTGAVKNLFGVIPGYEKPSHHARLADARLFADMLLDVAFAVSPRLTLMDAVLGMEGDGPGTGGRPRAIGALLASPDPVALDVAACDLVGLAPERVPTLVAARDRGLWSGDPADVGLAGDDAGPLRLTDFDIPARSIDPVGLGRAAVAERLLTPLIRELFSARPRPRLGRCTGCGTCARACPQGAIDIRDRLAVVRDDRCIRCYCCHELCPEGAVDLELRLAARAVKAAGLR